MPRAENPSFRRYFLGDLAKANAEDRKMRERYSDMLDEAIFEPHPDVRITEETIRTWAERLKADIAAMQELAAAQR